MTTYRKSKRNSFPKRINGLFSSKYRVIVFVCIFAAIGSAILLFAHAATPPFATVSTNGTTSGNQVYLAGTTITVGWTVANPASYSSCSGNTQEATSPNLNDLTPITTSWDGPKSVNGGSVSITGPALSPSVQKSYVFSLVCTLKPGQTGGTTTWNDVYWTPPLNFNLMANGQSGSTTVNKNAPLTISGTVAHFDAGASGTWYDCEVTGGDWTSSLQASKNLIFGPDTYAFSVDQSTQTANTGTLQFTATCDLFDIANGGNAAQTQTVTVNVVQAAATSTPSSSSSSSAASGNAPAKTGSTSSPSSSSAASPTPASGQASTSVAETAAIAANKERVQAASTTKKHSVLTVVFGIVVGLAALGAGAYLLLGYLKGRQQASWLK